MPNNNDLIRDTILRELYDIGLNAKGPKGILTGMRDLQTRLKKYGIKQQQVAFNLDYLVQKGWVVQKEVKSTFKTPRGNVQESVSPKYKISDVGIDKLEGASAYKRNVHFSNINITNIKGVTVVGEGNIVNTNWTDVANVLSQLEDAINQSGLLQEEDKLNLVADLGTIQTQLAKPNPNSGIIAAAWKTIETSVTAVAFADLMQRATDLLAPIFDSIAA